MEVLHWQRQTVATYYAGRLRTLRKSQRRPRAPRQGFHKTQPWRYEGPHLPAPRCASRPHQLECPETLRCTEESMLPVSYTHLRAHETDSYLVCRLLLE